MGTAEAAAMRRSTFRRRFPPNICRGTAGVRARSEHRAHEPRFVRDEREVSDDEHPTRNKACANELEQPSSRQRDEQHHPETRQRHLDGREKRGCSVSTNASNGFASSAPSLISLTVKNASATLSSSITTEKEDTARESRRADRDRPRAAAAAPRRETAREQRAQRQRPAIGLVDAALAAGGAARLEAGSWSAEVLTPPSVPACHGVWPGRRQNCEPRRHRETLHEAVASRRPAARH